MGLGKGSTPTGFPSCPNRMDQKAYAIEFSLRVSGVRASLSGGEMNCRRGSMQERSVLSVCVACAVCEARALDNPSTGLRSGSQRFP